MSDDEKITGGKAVRQEKKRGKKRRRSSENRDPNIPDHLQEAAKDIMRPKKKSRLGGGKGKKNNKSPKKDNNRDTELAGYPPEVKALTGKMQVGLQKENKKSGQINHKGKVKGKSLDKRVSGKGESGIAL